MYGPLGWIGYMRGYLRVPRIKGPTIRDHVATQRVFFFFGRDFGFRVLGFRVLALRALGCRV